MEKKLWIIQDFMLTRGDRVGDTVALWLVNVTLEYGKGIVDRRMKQAFDKKSAQAVRLVDGEGREVYRRDLWQEMASRQATYRAAYAARRKAAKKS